MITALHSKRNRPYLHALVFVLLASWIFLGITATCVMPAALMAMPELVSQCSEKGSHAFGHDQKHTQQMEQDCSLKPCFESKYNLFSDSNRPVKTDLTVFILCLVWTLGHLFLPIHPEIILRVADPPPGRRIPLIYRFCTLLN